MYVTDDGSRYVMELTADELTDVMTCLSITQEGLEREMPTMIGIFRAQAGVFVRDYKALHKRLKAESSEAAAHWKTTHRNPLHGL